MLYLEDNLTYENTININSLKLNNHSNIDLIYTADKLCEANYIKCIKSYYSSSTGPLLIATSITFEGHQLLDNIRDDKVYSQTKTILSSFKSVSIEIFSETASKVITSLISKQLGLPD